VIFDSHTTTLISAIVLIYFGTGPVKGFGVTLTIGVALSLFTSLVMTRLIFDFLLGRGWLNRIGMLHLIKNPHWDFMNGPSRRSSRPGRSSWWACATGFSCAAGGMGIDFVGGDAVTLSYKEKIGVDKIRAALRWPKWATCKSSIKRAPNWTCCKWWRPSAKAGGGQDPGGRVSGRGLPSAGA
jgi:SecD/SecF fusion protein